MARGEAPTAALLAIGIGIGLLVGALAITVPSMPAVAVVQFDAPSIRVNTLVRRPDSPPVDEPAPPEPITATIEFGLTASEIADRLAVAGILDDPGLFRVLARERGIDRILRSGVYVLFPGTPAGEILDCLTFSPQTPH